MAAPPRAPLKQFDEDSEYEGMEDEHQSMTQTKTWGTGKKIQDKWTNFVRKPVKCDCGNVITRRAIANPSKVKPKCETCKVKPTVYEHKCQVCKRLFQNNTEIANPVLGEDYSFCPECIGEKKYARESYPIWKE